MTHHRVDEDSLGSPYGFYANYNTCKKPHHKMKLKVKSCSLPCQLTEFLLWVPIFVFDFQTLPLCTKDLHIHQACIARPIGEGVLLDPKRHLLGLYLCMEIPGDYIMIFGNKFG